MNGLRKRKKLKVSTFYVYVRRSYIDSNFIYARKASYIHAPTHVKFTRQWKSTFTNASVL